MRTDIPLMSSIYVSETTDRKEFVTKIIKIYKQPIDKASTIFIKPNIVSFEPYPTTTHPETLDTILTLLSNKDIIIGDGHAIDTGFTKNILENSPIKKICQKHNLKLTNLPKTQPKINQSLQQKNEKNHKPQRLHNKNINTTK